MTCVTVTLWEKRGNRKRDRGRETIFYGIDLYEHYSRYIDIPSAGAYGTAYI